MDSERDYGEERERVVKLAQTSMGHEEYGLLLLQRVEMDKGMAMMGMPGRSWATYSAMLHLLHVMRGLLAQSVLIVFIEEQVKLMGEIVREKTGEAKYRLDEDEEAAKLLLVEAMDLEWAMDLSLRHLQALKSANPANVRELWTAIEDVPLEDRDWGTGE